MLYGVEMLNFLVTRKLHKKQNKKIFTFVEEVEVYFLGMVAVVFVLLVNERAITKATFGIKM